GLLGLAGAGLLAASPWLVDRSGPEPFYKGPLIFPLIALALLVAGALPSLVRLAASLLEGQGGLGRLAPPWAAVRLVGLMCLFPPALPLIGLEAAVALFACLGLLAVGWRRPLAGLAVALGLALVLHLAFKSLLDVWFPEPLLWALLEAAA
ncbi:MAG: hypothetical protein WD100_10445, partial [Tistlia sp.]